MNTVTTLSTDYKHSGGDRKRKRTADSKRTSEVWMYFTEIRTADHDVVYAVCHHCDRAYSSGRSTNGTSHLRRHKKSCTSKLPGKENVNNASMLHRKPKSGHCSYSSRTMEVVTCVCFKSSTLSICLFSMFVCLCYIRTHTCSLFQKQSIRHQGCAEARRQEDGPAC